MQPVFILSRTPGTADTVRWEEICHTKSPFIFITHEPYRDISRWNHVERGFPFLVYAKGWHKLSAHKTLNAAMKSAKKWAAE